VLVRTGLVRTPIDSLDFEHDEQPRDQADHRAGAARLGHLERSESAPGDEVCPAGDRGRVDEREAAVVPDAGEEAGEPSGPAAR